MSPEAATAKRLQKDLSRLEKKVERLSSKLGNLEGRHADGKLKTERFHAKKVDLKTQIRGYEQAARTIKGKLGKAKAAGIL